MTQRHVDENGYITIPENPISRAGVFEYLGSQIGAPVPDKVYKVFRPPEELSDPECLASFRNLPIIDDHVMLGSRDQGFTPPEEKGIHGITGAAVDFRENVLYSDIRIYSQALADKIDSGKRGLSLGYRCTYTPEVGIFAGQNYEFVQRSLRGNHLALVDEPRNDVYVLDNKLITFDSFSIQKEENNMTTTVEALDKKITSFMDDINKRFKAQDEAEMKAKEEEKAAADKAAKDEAEAKEKAEKEAADKAAKDSEGEGEAEKKMAGALDAALKKIESLEKVVEKFAQDGTKAIIGEVAKRDELASKLAPHIRAFDTAGKTLADVQAFGCEKLGLKVEKGQEGVALDGFLHNRNTNQIGFGIANDAGIVKSDEVSAFINGKKA